MDKFQAKYMKLHIETELEKKHQKEINEYIDKVMDLFMTLFERDITWARLNDDTHEKQKYDKFVSYVKRVKAKVNEAE